MVVGSEGLSSLQVESREISIPARRQKILEEIDDYDYGNARDHDNRLGQEGEAEDDGAHSTANKSQGSGSSKRRGAVVGNKTYQQNQQHRPPAHPGSRTHLPSSSSSKRGGSADDLSVVSDLTPSDEYSELSGSAAAAARRSKIQTTRYIPRVAKPQSSSSLFPGELSLANGDGGGDDDGDYPSGAAASDFVPLQNWQNARRRSLLESMTVHKLDLQGVSMIGRNEETKTLISAFQQVCKDEDGHLRRGVVFLGGSSGTGKTLLTEEIRPTIRRARAAFCTGKFNWQQHRDDISIDTTATTALESVVEPYAAFKMAFAELVQLILAISSSQKSTQVTSKGQWLQSGQNGANRHGFLRESSSSFDMSPHTSNNNIMSSSSTLLLGWGRDGENGRNILERVRSRLTTELEKGQLKLLKAIIPQLQWLLEDPSDDEVAAAAAVEKGSLPRISLGAESETDDASTHGPTPADGTAWKERSDRLKYAYRKFAQIVSMEFAPLLILIEDCQWADPASLELIESLVKDGNCVMVPCQETAENENDKKEPSDGAQNQPQEQGRILIVASYRDDEIDPETSPLAKLMKELDEYTTLQKQEGDASSGMYKITLGNLSVDETNEFISELLSLPLTDTRKLAEVVHAKTLGNAFFVREFLFTLAYHDHLNYSMAVMEWNWDLEKIRLEYHSAENVGDLMKEKVRSSSVSDELILPLAACFGATFEGSTLISVLEILEKKGVEDQQSHQSQRDHQESLDACVKEGFIEVVSTDVYRFVHNKVKEACLELRDPGELKRMRVAASDALLEVLKNAKKLEESLFTVVNLINFQINELGPRDPKRMKLAHLNSRAGKKSLKVAAFEAARKYFRIAIGLLAHDRWEKHHDFCVKLYSQASSAEYCCGNFVQMDKYCEELIERNDVPLLEKIVAYENRMASYAMRSELTKNVEVGEKVLKELSIRFPKRNPAIIFATVAGLAKIRGKMKKLSLDDIERLPIVSDKKNLVTMEVLDKFATAAYFGKSSLVPLVIFKMFDETLKKGLSPLSGVTLGMLALVFAGILEDFQLANKCSSAAIRILEKVGYRVGKSRTLELAWAYGFHWSTPTRNCLRPLMDGYTTGMETGTFESAFWCICFWLEFQFYVGHSLSILNADISTYQKQMEDYGFEKAVAATNTLWQVIRNLLGATHDENKYFEEKMTAYKAQNDDVMQAFVRRNQIYSNCFMHDFARAADLSLEWAGKCVKLCPGQLGSMEIMFAAGISCFEMARRTKKSVYKVKANKCLAKLSSWVSRGNPNCVAQESLLKAQNSALFKDEGRAMKDFEVAVLLAGRRGLVHIQAMANELFSGYLAEIGKIEESQYRLGDALKLYREWGSHSNVERVEHQKDFSLGLPLEIHLDKADD